MASRQLIVLKYASPMSIMVLGTHTHGCREVYIHMDVEEFTYTWIWRSLHTHGCRVVYIHKDVEAFTYTWM